MSNARENPNASESKRFRFRRCCNVNARISAPAVPILVVIAIGIGLWPLAVLIVRVVNRVIALRAYHLWRVCDQLLHDLQAPRQGSNFHYRLKGMSK
jgi:hypothetical protein